MNMTDTLYGTILAAALAALSAATATAAAVAALSASAVEFSKAGYWEAEGSPRRVETLTTGWEFSLDGFKTSKRVALPHTIDEGEIGFEASGCVNRLQPAWYRRKFDWKRHGARQFLRREAGQVHAESQRSDDHVPLMFSRCARSRT